MLSKNLASCQPSIEMHRLFPLSIMHPTKTFQSLNAFFLFFITLQVWASKLPSLNPLNPIETIAENLI
jgi:hypothetical protein